MLIAVMGARVAFLWRARRYQAPVALTEGATLEFFSGLITAGLGMGHLGGVTVVELARSPTASYSRSSRAREPRTLTRLMQLACSSDARPATSSPAPRETWRDEWLLCG